MTANPRSVIKPKIPLRPFTCSHCRKVTRLRPSEFPHSCLCGAYYDSWDSKPQVDEPRPRFKVLKGKRSPYTTGDRLRDLIHSLGIEPRMGCGCEALVVKMNVWGPEGCLKQSAYIVGRLEENSSKYGWREKFQAARKAVASGLAFKLNPLNPFPDLLAEAIRLSQLDITPLASSLPGV